jgi:KamA family protein
MNDNETISIETNQTGFEGDMRAGNRGVSPLEIKHSDHLRKYDPEMYRELTSSESLETIRQNLFSVLQKREMALFSDACDLETLERSNALNCIGVLKNMFAQRNESVSHFSTISTMLEIINEHSGKIKERHKAAYIDFFFIALGSLGLSDIYRETAPTFLCFDGREGANIRSDHLDVLAERCMTRINSYRSGLDPAVISKREANRDRMLDHLGADRSDWADYRWQQRNVFTDAHAIAEIVALSNEEGAAIELANKHGLPFGITPYYLSLFDKNASRTFDHAVRAQVIPPLSYVSGMLESKSRGSSNLDFMKEGQTSPVELVTRRYPMIAILKPFNACAQICVYCQRNWEIGNVSDPQAMASPESISRALDWFRSHPMVSEVLITGGDPALMPDESIIDLLRSLSEIEHVKRIRIGTRLPVVLPMRFTDQMVESLGKFHCQIGRPSCRERV